MKIEEYSIHKQQKEEVIKIPRGTASKGSKYSIDSRLNQDKCALITSIFTLYVLWFLPDLLSQKVV